jgi:hypothetical protein
VHLSTQGKTLMSYKGKRTGPRLKGGDEWDAFTRWRYFLTGMARSGVVKSIKRSYNKRARREEKRDIRKDRE